MFFSILYQGAVRAVSAFLEGNGEPNAVTAERVCHCIVEQPTELLNEPPAVRQSVLRDLIKWQCSENAGVARQALAVYLKAGFSAGQFADKLSELLQIGMSPFFEWIENGCPRNLLDLVMHHGASDAALLLVKAGIGHGYLSLPLDGSTPESLTLGNPDDGLLVALPSVKPSTGHGGYCLAHVLSQHGSLEEVSQAAEAGLNFSHSASNVPHPILLAALHNRTHTVAYFLQNEAALQTVRQALAHSCSSTLLLLGNQCGLPLFRQIYTHAVSNYSGQIF
jgi:hypothetical protein